MNYLASHVSGTAAFLKSISLEALGLGVNLAAGAHEILLHAECILTKIQPSLPHPIRSNLKANLGSVGSDQPEDAQHGLKQVNIIPCCTHLFLHLVFIYCIDFSLINILICVIPMRFQLHLRILNYTFALWDDQN